MFEPEARLDQNPRSTLRVVTYNILDGALGREAKILRVLECAQPDIVILQEVFEETPLRRWAQALQAESFIGPSNERRHVALLSRLPIVAATSHKTFPPIWRNVLVARVEVLPGTVLTVIGVHPVASLGVGFELWRRWEALFVTQLARQNQDALCLVAGDFNAIAPGDRCDEGSMPAGLRATLWMQGGPMTWSLGVYQRAGLIDCYRARNPTSKGYTLPAVQPNARLDYILVNSAMRPSLTNSVVVDRPDVVTMASDHLPVLAEFEFRNALGQGNSPDATPAPANSH